MRRKRYLRHGLWTMVLCAVLVFSAQSSQADDPEFYPGLPDNTATTGLTGWSNVAQGGLSYARRAKQWFRSPDGMVTSRTETFQDPRDGLTQRAGVHAESYFVSPEGAPDNYGYLAPMTVRSVGFGMIPVEATVQVSQRREDGYPVPVKATVDVIYRYAPSTGGYHGELLSESASDTVVTDAFNVQLLDVRVDGVDLELTGDCRTVSPAPVTLVGHGYSIPYPDASPTARADWFRAHDPSEYYNPLAGGDLTGTMTIPPFTGCTTASGDDLSALMTLSVSGPDNPITARGGWPCSITKENVGWPAAPGQSTPKSTLEDATSTAVSGDAIVTVPGCYGTKKAPYPARPDD